AIKFSHDGGYVSFLISVLGNDDHNCNIEMIITDTGVGIDKSNLPLLFQSFSQEKLKLLHTHHSGTGLSLAIMSFLVQLMKGTIKVKSGKNKGTTFIVKLPLPTRSEQKNYEINYPTNMSIDIPDAST